MGRNGTIAAPDMSTARFYHSIVLLNKRRLPDKEPSSATKIDTNGGETVLKHGTKTFGAHSLKRHVWNKKERKEIFPDVLYASQSGYPCAIITMNLLG